MAFALLAIGAILLVAALRGTQGTLASALTTDIPGYAKWALAIVLIGAIGFIPNMRPISRALLALVLVVIVLHNYRTILSGLTSAGSDIGGSIGLPSLGNLGGLLSGPPGGASGGGDAIDVQSLPSVVGQ